VKIRAILGDPYRYSAGKGEELENKYWYKEDKVLRTAV